jgi:metal-responsive CopG/Arc/MetJ family transcriptional regulator
MVARVISRVDPPGMEKVLISLPQELLADVDREAERRQVSRSAFLRRAALHELKWRDPEEIEAAMAAGQAAMADFGPFDAAEEIRRMRDEDAGRRR